MKLLAGVGENKNIERAASMADFDVELVYSAEEFLNKIREGAADAYVRGSLPSARIMRELKSYGPINRASWIRVGNSFFLLAPVGIDEGRGLNEKLIILNQAAEFLLNANIKPDIAVLSAGRPGDTGRAPEIDRSINDGEELTAMVKDKYKVRHYYILLEEAVRDGCNIILAPDGISGNLIFRSLVLVGSARSFGAVALGMDSVFIDTSRSQTTEGYLRALKFAYCLAKKIDIKTLQ